MAFLRGHLNAESGLVLNEHSLKLLMLERCARGEKRTCGKGRKPSAEVSSWIYVCCVLTASLERINTPLCAGIIRWIVFFPIRQRCPRYGMDIQVLHSAQQNAVWSDPTYMFVFFLLLLSQVEAAAHLAFSACRRRKMASKRYDITTEQTGLAIYWEVYMSTHTRQSQWYTKQSSETYMEWRVAFFIIVLSTTQ